MRKLIFVMPVHGRLGLAKICLRQLRRTCEALLEREVIASAIVVSDPYSLAVLEPENHGFGWVRRNNQFTSRRFNDGIQLATDPRYNPAPADFVVPFGSDDWVDHRLFSEPLPESHQIFGFKHMSFVREDGREISAAYLDYDGGCGIRIIPRELVAPLGYRPADEDRERGCDTSILLNLKRRHGDTLEIKHWDAPSQYIVDWKSPGEQLNQYEAVKRLHHMEATEDPFGALATYYPDDALNEMRSYYGVPA